MSVHRDDAVGILIYNDAVGVHAEGADVVFIFFRTVYDLAFIQLVREVREDDGRKFHTHAYIHTV